jgi:hypothetical protein
LELATAEFITKQKPMFIPLLILSNPADVAVCPFEQRVGEFHGHLLTADTRHARQLIESLNMDL